MANERRTSLSIAMNENLAKKVKLYALKHNMQISEFVVGLIKKELENEKK